MQEKIYLDTSVIGGCFDDEFSLWSNNLVRDIKNGLFVPVLSKVVENEVQKAPQSVRDKYNEILECNAEILLTNDESLTLAKTYQARKIITENFFFDALHIALATVYKIDLLVSWNFKHIVHYDKIRLFNTVNLELGYNSIAIFSPMEVTTK